jgi:hypothetical protein
MDSRIDRTQSAMARTTKIATKSTRLKIGFDGGRASERRAVAFCPLIEVVGRPLLVSLFLLKRSAL